MARIFTGLFGGNKQTSPPATALRINTSLQGVPIALLLGGTNRLAGNLIDYFGFQSIADNSQHGGKGGGGGKGGSGQYKYYVSVVIAVCEAPGGAFMNGGYMNGTGFGIPDGSEAGDINWGAGAFPAEFFEGSYSQAPWSLYASAYNGVYAGRALAYRGIAYAGLGIVPLGNSPSLPNLNFTPGCIGNSNNVVPGQVDGDASIALTEFLTNEFFGVGLPANRLGSLSQWQQYCLALGLAVSPVLASATQASAFANDLIAATNSAACWQDGVLEVVPYGDAAVSAGEISLSAETYLVPTGPSFPNPPNPNLDYPQITTSFFSRFAGDAGVTYQSGGALTRVNVYAPTGVAGTGSPGPGQYYVSNGIYYFNPSDIGQTVIISYNWAAIGAYVPNTTPLYDFTIDDCLPNQASIGSGIGDPSSPFVVVRKPRDQMLNNIKVEYLDRNNNYNPVDIELKDEASIVAFKRERPSELKQRHFFCLAGAAQQSAALDLIRAQVPRTFQWTVGRHFALILQLMELYTVTDPGQGLDRQGVRLIEVQENSDFSYTLTAEEYLGTVSAPLYGSQANSGFDLNVNAAPGSVNAPIIFEPTDELASTNALGPLQVWLAVSGHNTALWGGAWVWVSYDGETYQRLPDPITGPARMGVLTGALPAVTPNPIGNPTIDPTNILSVDLTESAGTLSSGTLADALALNTACYVGPANGGGEILSYETATLTAVSKYNLSYLIRGVYGTEADIASHPIGTPFARLDNQIFAFAFDQSRIGATIFIKLQSFNLYEGGLQALSDCIAYQYTIAGTALASPLPTVQNLRTVYDVNTGFTELDWDIVSDFRTVRYEVRSGSSFTAAMSLGTVAHPPFRVPGDGTYWVAAVAQPASGLTVYSEQWESATIAGAVITQTIIKTIDLKAANWPGTFVGGAGVDSVLDAIRTGGGNILTDPDILHTGDILNYGGGSSGSYYPNDTFIDLGYVTTPSIAMKYRPTGIPVGQNILAIGDILGTPDILGAASTAFIDVHPLIATATTIGNDLYAEGDLYDPTGWYSGADLYRSLSGWSGFQKFSPGSYQCRYLDFGMVLDTIDPNTIAYNLEWVITVTIPARVDQYAVTTSSSADTTITFAPTGQSAAPFNGGSGPSNLPAITWGIINAQAGDDFIITALSLSSISFSVFNGGSRVVRNLNLFAEGF